MTLTDTRRRVLDVALECFLADGYEQTTIARIRKLSGTSNGANAANAASADAGAGASPEASPDAGTGASADASPDAIPQDDSPTPDEPEANSSPDATPAPVNPNRGGTSETPGPAEVVGGGTG